MQGSSHSLHHLYPAGLQTGILLIEEIAVKMMQREMSKFVRSGRFDLRRIAPLVGAVILACVAVPQASAQSSPQHAQYRDQDHSRGDRRNGISRADHQPQAHRGEPRPNSRDSTHRGHDTSWQAAHPGSGYPAPRAGYQTRHEAVPSYRFNGSDRAVLPRYYQPSLRRVQAERRPPFAPGHVIAPAYRPHVQVLPSHYRHHLPPPPRGYEVGYYQGYGVVYDPLSFTILSVLDLMIR